MKIFLTMGVFALVIITVVALSYQQGYYAGMDHICKDGKLMLSENGSIGCYGLIYAEQFNNEFVPYIEGGLFNDNS